MNTVGRKYHVLDHGHVILQDVMGSDADIADGARTSYQRGTKTVNDDRGLIRHLMRKRHTSPFHLAVMKFHIKLPIFVERQFARHRMASWNEVSARYSQLPDEWYVPEPEVVRAQSTTNKQGRGGELSETAAKQFIARTDFDCGIAFDGYQQSLDANVARELARIELPVATYTEKVWQMDLKNLLDFLQLRMDEHAQWEIQQYANIMADIVQQFFPITWEAFEDYRLNAITLSGPEIDWMNKHLTIRCGADEPDTGRLSDAEYREFKEKLYTLGVIG